MTTLQTARILTAMVTPFDEQGEIDYKTVPTLVEHLLTHHTEGLILAGTTGESPTLTHDEEIELFQKVIEIVDGRVPIICGVGTNDTQDTIDFVKEIAKMDGVAAGLCVVPYYNKPSQEGLYQHFKAVSQASELPIILYNVPGRTVVGLTVETVLRLAELPNIIGIKECSGLDAISEIQEKTADDFIVFSGEDTLAFATKAVGAQGIISVSSHVLGDQMYEMYEHLDNGRMKEAAKIHRQLVPKMNALFSVASSPAPVKSVLKYQGVDCGKLRLPLVACTPQEEEKILMMFR